jgi:GAF domain-containing protein
MKNEGDRLKALADYHIMDSAPEQAFDDLVVLASQICGCPIATVTLVDETRQWFKARIGVESTETPREQSFCAHALLEPENLMVVPDATRDKRFYDNPLVTKDPNIRFYAGAPLLTPAGMPLGTICVIDRKPREFLVEQRKALLALGRQTSHMLELRRISRELARALDNVRTLEGLLPICVHCKAIRDENDEWSRIDAYMVKRTSASFTHGICPDCAARLYPDLDLTGGKGTTPVAKSAKK